MIPVCNPGGCVDVWILVSFGFLKLQHTTQLTMQTMNEYHFLSETTHTFIYIHKRWRLAGSHLAGQGYEFCYEDPKSTRASAWICPCQPCSRAAHALPPLMFFPHHWPLLTASLKILLKRQHLCPSLLLSLSLPPSFAFALQLIGDRLHIAFGLQRPIRGSQEISSDA